jgi:flagellar basal body-associated protein FliL
MPGQYALAAFSDAVRYALWIMFFVLAVLGCCWLVGYTAYLAWKSAFPSPARHRREARRGIKEIEAYLQDQWTSHGPSDR